MQEGLHGPLDVETRDQGEGGGGWGLGAEQGSEMGQRGGTAVVGGAVACGWGGRGRVQEDGLLL